MNGSTIYNDGTVAVTNGSQTVTGTDTAWLTNMPLGADIQIPANTGEWYQAAVTDEGAITLDRGYAGTTATGVEYTAQKTTSFTQTAVNSARIVSAYKGVAFLTTSDQYWKLNQNTTADKAGTWLTTAKADKFRAGMFGSGDFVVDWFKSADSTWNTKIKVAAADGAVTIDGLSLDKDDVGLGNVDNTSDEDKPVSTATQTALGAKADAAATTTALAAKAPLASPTFTGTVSAAAITASGLITTNGQIKFPATQNPSADANTLDDYEEGTFTPTWFYTGGNTGVAYTVQTGDYTKIGRLVLVRGTITLSSKGTSTGIIEIGGLPFAAISQYGLNVSIYSNFNLPTGCIGLSGYINTSVWAVATNSSTGANFLADTAATDTSEVRFSGVFNS